MDEIALRALADELRAIGFQCSRCGDCCRGQGTDGSLVMVSRDEVERVASRLARPLFDVAEPYPEVVEVRGARCRLGWALRRDRDGACRLHDGEGCSIYADRPHLCRTYPFMLDGERLIVSDCPGIGGPLTDEDAVAIAEDLIMRRDAEEDEARLIRDQLASAALHPGDDVLIDSWGVTGL